MDFGQVLHAAQRNGKSNKNEVRYYSTKFEPPKKEKKAKELSDNIKKFLARKEAEEKQKAEEARRKKEELLALRSQDKKATRRVNVMLKRTKSANQSVIQDAVDNDNTAVTLAGPMQPDEDDYGYVSQEASAFYNKMMEKYSKLPDEPKFDKFKKKVSTNLSGTKDRVRAALEKEKEEAMLPHRRKRKHKDTDQKEDENNEVNYEPPEKHAEPSKSKPTPKPKSAPPPMNFAELLKIAEKKQFEPIIIEKKEKEEEKLLTKKQKKEMEKEREYLQRKESKREADVKHSQAPERNSSNNKIPKLGDKFPKLNGDGNIDKIPKPSGQKPDKSDSGIKMSKLSSTHTSAKPSLSKPSGSSLSPHESIKKSTSILSSDRQRGPIENKQLNNRKCAVNIPQTTSSKYSTYNKPNNRDQQNNNLKDDKQKSSSKLKELLMKQKKISPEDLQSKKLDDMRVKKFPPNDMKPKKFPPDDVKSKQFPPKDLKHKQFPPKDLKSKQFPPTDVWRKDYPTKDVKKKPAIGNKRMILDDDSEYDSEMDDFIDDGDVEGDYSKYITEIFGYDRTKYRDVDNDDIDNMESTFAQQMKEEVISRKIGIMEDLEDMRNEEEEKKRKALLKKKR